MPASESVGASPHQARRACHSGRMSDTSTNPAPDPARRRLAHLVLNQVFLERHSDAEVRAYVDAVVAAGAESVGGDEDEVAAHLRARMDEAGLTLPDESYRLIAEQLHRSGGAVAISTDDGRVLYGDPSLAPDEHEPDVHGTDDPAHPDRPLYS